uniref:NADH dehydrogenase subunit 4L n=1 Tax=Atractophaedusa antibouddah TaxID=1885788 RepID=A0A224A1S5_9EUPU|nr:NADH dehydrogenase subunit 4L [Atractophaedusa antibouddah]
MVEIYIMSLLMVWMSILFFTVQYHYLNCLLILESIMLFALTMILYLYFNAMTSGSMFLLILTLAVCEAALGLVLLVSYVKLSGNDYMSLM